MSGFLQSNKAYRFRSDIAYREVDGEYYFLSADSMFHSVSDPVGAFILGLLEKDKNVTIGGLTKAIATSFEVDKESAKQDLSAFVEELVRKRILEVNPT